MAVILSKTKSTYGNPYAYYKLETTNVSDRTANSVKVTYKITSNLASAGSSLGSGYSLDARIYTNGSWSDYISVKSSSAEWSGTTEHTKTITLTTTGISSSATKLTKVYFQVKSSAGDKACQLNTIACKDIAISSFHQSPIVNDWTLSENNAALQNIGIAANTYVKGLSQVKVNITNATYYDNASFQKMTLYTDSNNQTSEYAKINDLTTNPAYFTPTKAGSDFYIYLTLTDNQNGVSDISNTRLKFKTIDYTPLTLESKSKRAGQTSGQVSISCSGNYYNDSIGNVNQGGTYKPTIKYKFWRNGTTEPSWSDTSSQVVTVNDTFPNAITVFNGTYSITNLNIGSITETDPNYFEPKYAYKVKIQVNDNFTTQSSGDISIPVGEATWTEYADRVDFKKLTIQGVEVIPGGGGGTSTDVKINGTSITSNNVADIKTYSTYNSSSNKIATMNDLPTIPTNHISYTQSTETVAGNSKTVSKINPETIYVPNGLIMGGAAGNAGLVTRGICGSSVPTSTGGATKDHLYLNCDGNNTFNNARQVIVNATELGDHLGSNMYKYALPRGEIVKNWVESKGYTTNTGTITGIKMNGASKGTSGVVDLGTVITSHQDISGKQDKITSSNKLDYSLLSNTPTIPTVNDKTLTIKQNTIAIGTFSANSVVDKDINITVPTKTSDLTNDDNVVKDASYVHTDNNYTTTEKNKLSGIASGAEVNVQSDWNQSDNTKDDYIKNKPTIPTVNNATLTIQKNGSTVNTFTANASSNVTANITVPTKVSDLTNDSGFITKSVNNLDNYTKTNSLATVATSGSYSDLSNKPTIPTKTGDLINNGDGTLGYKYINDIGVYEYYSGDYELKGLGVYDDDRIYFQTTHNNSYYNEILANLSDIPYKTSELTNDSGFITSSYHDNTKQDKLTAGTNITIDANNVISASGGGGTATDVQVNGTSITSGGVANLVTQSAYNSSTNKIATKSDIPTNTNQLTNGAGFITSSYHDSSKQDTLVSGTNIKTINNNSIVGSGDLALLTQDTFVQNISSLSAGGTKTLTYNITKSGYTPIAISGYAVAYSAMNVYGLLINSDTEAQMSVRNMYSGAASNVNARIYVLYIKS